MKIYPMDINEAYVEITRRLIEDSNLEKATSNYVLQQNRSTSSPPISYLFNSPFSPTSHSSGTRDRSQAEVPSFLANLTSSQNHK